MLSVKPFFFFFKQNKFILMRKTLINETEKVQSKDPVDSLYIDTIVCLLT